MTGRRGGRPPCAALVGGGVQLVAGRIPLRHTAEPGCLGCRVLGLVVGTGASRQVVARGTADKCVDIGRARTERIIGTGWGAWRLGWPLSCPKVTIHVGEATVGGG